MSDDQLYQAYLAGDQAAGDELMLRYGDALTAYLDAFVHHVQDAEDLKRRNPYRGGSFLS